MKFLLTSLRQGVYSAPEWEKVGELGDDGFQGLEGHVPVMSTEVLSWLRPSPASVILDCTVGYCGHTRLILEASAPNGRVIGIDRDAQAVDSSRRAMERFGSRLDLVNGRFVDLKAHLTTRGISMVHGVLFDLGVSSAQLDDPGRGFSFRADGPLDMRMDQSSGTTAEDIVNRASETDLADIIFQFGEERYSRRIARAITVAREERTIRTTMELGAIVRSAVPPHYRRGRIHPATRTFQALRIAVNKELEHLESALRDAADVLAPAGRLCVIAFHSLEDRIVKQTFRSLSERQLRILTKKPQLPTKEEMHRNPRSRSAKLRVAERMAREGHA